MHRIKDEEKMKVHPGLSIEGQKVLIMEVF